MHVLRRILLWTLFVAGAGDLAQAQVLAPAPSQVTPPRLPTEPRPAPQIPSVSPPEAPAFPPDAEKLSFVLTGVDIEGEFEEFVAIRRELAAPLIGKRVTVAQIFDFATKLQEAYVGAGYLLVRVVVVPQELGEKGTRQTSGDRRVYRASRRQRFAWRGAKSHRRRARAVIPKASSHPK